MKTVTFRLTDEQHQQAKEEAKKEGLTLSQKLRWFITQWLALDTQVIYIQQAESYTETPRGKSLRDGQAQ